MPLDTVLSKTYKLTPAGSRFGCRDGLLKSNTYLDRRSLIDQIVALILLIPGSVVIALAGIAVRLTSRGPMFYKQTRVGQYGKLFRIYKIRTMRVQAEKESGAVWAGQNDPRITTVGKLLRWVHWDELPQLVNVLLGEMALIGPRPERPEIVIQLQKEVPGYLDRLTVLPGITGLAQMRHPSDECLSDVRRKLSLDQFYIRNTSIRLDLHILGGTVPHLLGCQRYWTRRKAKNK